MPATERKCTVCKVRGPYRTVGLKAICFSDDCFEMLIADAAAKARKKHEAKANREARELKKRQRAERQERLKELEPMPKLCARIQNDVNKYLRLVDIYENRSCISCGFGPVEHAGHLHHAGTKWRVSRFRFSHIIIHGQCTSCNSFKGGGNHEEYKRGIVARYGQDYLDEIQELKARAERGDLEKLGRDEVIDMGAWHRRAAKELHAAIKSGREPAKYFGRFPNQW